MSPDCFVTYLPDRSNENHPALAFVGSTGGVLGTTLCVETRSVPVGVFSSWVYGAMR